MTRALVQKKNTRGKSGKIVRPGEKHTAKRSDQSNKTPVKSKASVARSGVSASFGTRDKASANAQHPVHKESKFMEAESRKPSSRTGASSVQIDASPRLLRHTKTTSAALDLLQKGIELIYKKEFKKARAELKLLLETYPSETEILVRARSYVQICEREEASQKKQAITADQLYAIGVLEHNQANYDAAISYFLQSLDNHPKADYIYYSVAASMAMKGDLAQSLVHLRKAIELNEDSRVYAKNDNDFSSLLSKKEFTELVGIAQPPESA
jgi:tetratricopeptide (TPR) repeat protein